MSRLIHRSFVRHNKIISVNIFLDHLLVNSYKVLWETPYNSRLTRLKNFESSKCFHRALGTKDQRAPPVQLGPRYGTKSRRVTKAAPIKGVYTQWCVRWAAKMKAHPWEFRVHAIHTRENLFLWTHRRPSSTCTECALWKPLHASKILQTQSVAVLEST